MNYQEIRTLLTLDMIRHTGNCVPNPLCRDWEQAEEIIKELLSQGLLQIDSDCYTISLQGKKTLLLFASERLEMAAPLERYREITIDKEVIDGRIPMLAFCMFMNPPEDREAIMKAGIFAILWEDLVNMLLGLVEIEDSQWQQLLVGDKIYEDIENLADPDAWRKLGKTEFEAKMTGKWLLNPAEVE